MKIEQETSCKLYTFNEYELAQHDAEVRKPLEEEIIELKEHIRALKSSHDLSHQAYLFAKNEGLDLQNQERQKVIAELEEWVEMQPTKVTYDYNTFDGKKIPDTEYIESFPLKQKLNELKGE